MRARRSQSVPSGGGVRRQEEGREEGTTSFTWIYIFKYIEVENGRVGGREGGREGGGRTRTYMGEERHGAQSL